jgi:hypothetical protein
MFFRQKINIKLLILIFLGCCLLTAFALAQFFPAYDNGNGSDTDILLAVFFRIPLHGLSWDFIYKTSGVDKLIIISEIILLSLLMERSVSYRRYLDKEENEQ